MYPTIEQTDSQDLCRRITDFLIERGVRFIDQARLTADGGVLTVRGWLASADDQRLCIACCRHTAGVVRVVDRTHVARHHRPKRRRPSRAAAPAHSAPLL